MSFKLEDGMPLIGDLEGETATPEEATVWLLKQIYDEVVRLNDRIEKLENDLPQMVTQIRDQISNIG